MLVPRRVNAKSTCSEPCFERYFWKPKKTASNAVGSMEERWSQTSRDEHWWDGENIDVRFYFEYFLKFTPKLVGSAEDASWIAIPKLHCTKNSCPDFNRTPIQGVFPGLKRWTYFGPTFRYMPKHYYKISYKFSYMILLNSYNIVAFFWVAP